MPFQNSRQLGVCVGKAQDDIGKGKSPKWNCEEYMCAHGDGDSATCSRVRRGAGMGSKIHQGPRGGYYFTIVFEGKERKYYIAERNQKAMLAKFGLEKKNVKLGSYKGGGKRRKSSPGKKRKSSPRKSPTVKAVRAKEKHVLKVAKRISPGKGGFRIY